MLIHRSNQRGGRMLSVVDLIAAETLSEKLADVGFVVDYEQRDRHA